jgi:hypothetical protein
MKKETTGGVIPGEMSASDVADQVRERKTRGPKMYKPDKIRTVKSRGVKTGTSGVHVEQVIAVPDKPTGAEELLKNTNLDPETAAEIRELAKQVHDSWWEDEEVIDDLKGSLKKAGLSDQETKEYMEDLAAEDSETFDEPEPVSPDKQREDALKEEGEEESAIRERIQGFDNPKEETRERVGEIVDEATDPEHTHVQNKKRSLWSKLIWWRPRGGKEEKRLQRVIKNRLNSPRNSGRKPKAKDKRDEAA